MTPEGRAIAIGLMICGVGMFGALSGIVASLFLGKSAQENTLAEEVRLLREGRRRGESGERVERREMITD